MGEQFEMSLPMPSTPESSPDIEVLFKTIEQKFRDKLWPGMNVRSEQLLVIFLQSIRTSQMKTKSV